MSSVTEEIPTPTAVREQLAQALVEVDLLRRLLRVAERAEKRRRAKPPKQEAVSR